MTEQPPPFGPVASSFRRARRLLGRSRAGGTPVRAGALTVLAALLWTTAAVGHPAGRILSASDDAVVLTAGYTPTPPEPVQPRQAPAYTPPTYTPPPTYAPPAYTAPRYTPPTQAPRPANPQPAPNYQHTAPAYPGTQSQPGYQGTHPGYQGTHPGYPGNQPGYPGTDSQPGNPRPRPEHPHPTPGNPPPNYPTPSYPRPTPVRPTPTQPPPVRISPLPPPTPVRPQSVPAYPPPGTQLVTVPRVIGLGLYVAEDRLRAAGLTVGSVSVTHSADIAGAVVQQSPKDGTSVQTGTTVDLVVAQP